MTIILLYNPLISRPWQLLFAAFDQTLHIPRIKKYASANFHNREPHTHAPAPIRQSSFRARQNV